jgi:hypothetical protein
MMPRFTFENKFTFGNLVTIITTIGGLLAGYITLANTVAQSAEAVKAIPAIENRVTTIETRINMGQQAREQFQAETAAALAELRNQNLQILQSVAALVARLDEKDRHP